MNLQSRVLILYLCIALLVLVLIGGVLPATLHEQNLNTISKDSINQLRHIDFAISNFIGGVRYDVLELSQDDEVSTPDDAGFTNFLNASEDTFRYSIGETEQDIIDTLKNYQATHPYVSSAYMGRENGAFVRSYPRARPTAYDPRERPWYILAKEHPGEVVVTEPYRAVTTPDINIGIEKALIDRNGTVYGVVGADITLVNLTGYISRFDVGRESEMILVDQNGMIIATRNSSRLYGNISDILLEQTPAFLMTKEGVLVLSDTYLMYYTSPELGWKIGVFIPSSSIEQMINESIVRILLFVLLALILLSVITIIMLNQTVIRPLSSLTEVSRRIAETGDLDQTIETGGSGEIGVLSQSFKAMVGRIRKEEQGRKQALAELADYRDHLENIVTERTRELSEANERLKELDRLKSMFIASMSHELRTPLNSIIGFTGIMAKGLAGPINAEQEKQLGMVQDSARHLLALINDVIDISKIEAGKIEAEISTFNLADVISTARNTFGPAAQERGLVLNMEIPGSITVTSDERRVKQVIMNLVSNAIKFTDKGGRVDVKVAQKGAVVEVLVMDTGIGIGKEDLEQLFRPFVRVIVPGRVTEGTGLGLYLSKKLARFLGGDIMAESEPDKGSVFTFAFPVTYEKQEDL